MEPISLRAQHRQDNRDLRSKIQALKNSIPKGDKKKKKEVQQEIAALEAQSASVHEAELKNGRSARNFESNEENSGNESFDAEENEILVCISGWLLMWKNDGAEESNNNVVEESTNGVAEESSNDDVQEPKRRVWKMSKQNLRKVLNAARAIILMILASKVGEK